MSIDYSRLDAAAIKPVTKKIPVPELKSFFSEDEDPVWEIRNLTGAELAITNEAAEAVSRIKTVLKAIAAGTSSELESGMKTFFNKDEATPEDLARRHKMLELASIPPCPESTCVRLAQAKPTTFFKITNEIVSLTGDGADLGK